MSVRNTDQPIQHQIRKQPTDACTYDVEAPPMRKDSSKLMKVNKRSGIKGEKRKNKNEFTGTSIADML